MVRNAMDKGEAEEYRILRHTPLFSEGKYIYVVSTYVTGNIDNVVAWEVEAYKPETLEFVKAVRLQLDPEEKEGITQEQQAKIAEETELLKESLGRHTIKNTSFATNGETLCIESGSMMFFFDLNFGSRLPETLDKIPNEKSGYNYHTNTFWYFKSESALTLKSYKIEGFENKVTKGDTSAVNFSDLCKERTKLTLEKQKNEKKLPPRNLEKFLMSLGNKTTEEDSIPSAEENKGTDLSSYLILYTMSKGCEEIEAVLSKMDALYPDLIDEKLECQTSLFRSQYGPAVSYRFVEQVTKALERYSKFVEGDMTDENIYDQYQFLWLASIVQKLLVTLERLGLKLNQVVQDKDLTTKFTELISNTFTKV